MYTIGSSVLYQQRPHAVVGVDGDTLTLIPLNSGATCTAAAADCTPAPAEGVYFDTLRQALDRHIEPLYAAHMAQLAAEGETFRDRVMRLTVKSGNPDDDPLIEGWGMLFTDEQRKDLTGTFFDNATRLLLNYYKNAPLWYEHGMDSEYGADPVGQRVSTLVLPRGIYVTHKLHRAHPKFAVTLDRVNKGELGLSSDTLIQYSAPNYDESTGRFAVWPVAGWSLTAQPAEPGLGRVTASEYVTALKSFISGQAGDRRTDDNSDPTLQTVIESAESSKMDPITQLAEFLGCEPTLDAVEAALTQLLTQLESGELTPPSEMAGALGMDASTATGASVAKALRDMYDGAKAAIAAPAPAARAFNYAALSNFAGGVRKSAGIDTLPYHVEGGDDDETDGDSDGEKAPPPVKRTWYGGNVNKGAKKPGILSAVKALAVGKPGNATSAFKSILGTDNVTGGYMLNRQLSNQILEPLYAQEIMLALGAQRVPMDGIETLTVRKMKTGSTAYWAGAGAPVNDSSQNWATLTLTLKELVAEVIISNKLLANAGPEYETTIRNDLVKSMRLAMDKAGFLGTGSKPSATGNTGAEPLGLLNTPNITNTALGTGNGAQIKLSDIVDAVGRLEDANVEETPEWGWAFHSRTKRAFTNLADANGNPLFRQDWTRKEEQALLGYKFLTSTQIPTNRTVGSANNTSLLFFGDWSQAAVGIGLDVSITVDTSRYIRERQTLIQAVAYMDFGVFYPEAFQIISAIKP